MALRPLGRAALCCVVLGTPLTGCDRGAPASAPPPLVEVEPFRPGEQHDVATFPAEVTARYAAPVAFQVGGRIAQRLVDTGDPVAAGQVLARLDPRDLERELEAAMHQLEAARSRRQRSDRALRRLENLGEGRFASATELDAARDATNAAAARVRELAARLALARNRLDYAVLRAATEGVITARFVDRDQVVAAGEPAFAVARLDALDATAWIAEHQIDLFTPQLPVQVRLWALPKATFDARIRETAPRAEGASRSFRIRATLPQDARLRLGQSGTLSLTRPAPRLGSVPVASVRHDPAQGPVVLLVESDGVIELRPVTLGELVDNRVIVRNGLEPGDRVVLLGARALQPGQRVRVREAP